MIIGNLIMLGYVGLLGTRRGMNFGLLASIVFGRKGFVLASGLLPAGTRYQDAGLFLAGGLPGSVLGGLLPAEGSEQPADHAVDVAER
jgi:hypothetical protein